MGQSKPVSRPRVTAGRKGFKRLRQQISGLQDQRIDYDDRDAEAAYYATGGPVLEAVIASRAGDLDGLKVKAHALVLAAGGLDFGLDDTVEHRVIASILGDLVALAEPEV